MKSISNKKAILAIVLVGAIIVAGAASALLILNNRPNPKQTTYVDQKGSDTMLELALEWASEYHKNHNDVVLNVSGGGSNVGISELIKGNIDIAQASRAMNDTEIVQAEANGVEPYQVPVAIDGIAIIVHASNPISTITMDQLRGIFNGTITNWVQLGGDDLEITLYGRHNTSGTYSYFKEKVLNNGAYSANLTEEETSTQILNMVDTEAGAIGYVGLGYIRNDTVSKPLALAKTSSDVAYEPTNESAVLSGKYELSRYLYLYTDGVPAGEMKEYILWILSDDGQKIATETGFYALPTSIVTEILAKIG